MNLALTMHTQLAWQPSCLANQTVFLESLSTDKQTAWCHFCSGSYLDLMVDVWLTLGLSEFKLRSVPLDAYTGSLAEEPRKEVEWRERQHMARTSWVTQILFIYTEGEVLRDEFFWGLTYTILQCKSCLWNSVVPWRWVSSLLLLQREGRDRNIILGVMKQQSQFWGVQGTRLSLQFDVWVCVTPTSNTSS